MRTALLAAALAAASASTPGTPEKYHRSVEQTFLTYPEWFLVSSPAEYAHFIDGHPPSDFPFFSHIGQFWRSYAAVTRAIGERHYPNNPGYHVMIVVIGVSTTVEYTLKAAYETLFGRVTEMLRSGPPTAEDRLAARTAQEYVDFIRVRPWYEFDFVTPLRRVWTETGALGRDLPRKWERKIALSNEYAAKALYGWLIMKGTHATYEEESTVTAVVVDRLPRAGPAPDGVQVLETRPDASALVLLPRYAAFTEKATALARGGATFREIAGNDSVILVSVLGPSEAPLASLGFPVLFTDPILTEPGRRRVVLVVPVTRLAEALVRFAQPPSSVVEHVYDY